MCIFHNTFFSFPHFKLVNSMKRSILKRKKEAIMKLAILSDTHNLLRPQVLEMLSGVDAILHGGDCSRQSILDALKEYAPLYVVRGNNDKEWAEYLPHDLRFQLGGKTFYMVHKKAEIPRELPGIDVVIYGHSHKYAEDIKDGILYLNPGSCGPRRFNQEITMALMEIDGDQISIEKVLIPHEVK